MDGRILPGTTHYAWCIMPFGDGSVVQSISRRNVKLSHSAWMINLSSGVAAVIPSSTLQYRPRFQNLLPTKPAFCKLVNFTMLAGSLDNRTLLATMALLPVYFQHVDKRGCRRRCCADHDHDTSVVKNVRLFLFHGGYIQAVQPPWLFLKWLLWTYLTYTGFVR